MSEETEAPRYKLDEDTRELLEAALNMVSQAATLQLDENSASGLINLCDEIAHRFYIESVDYDVSDPEDRETAPDDRPTITVYKTPKREKPRFRIVVNNELDDTPPDDDDPMH